MGDVDTLAEAAEKMLQARSLVMTLDDEFLLYLVDMTLMQFGKAIASKLREDSPDDAGGEIH